MSKHYTVLIVEDESIIAMGLKAKLQDRGYIVAGMTATEKDTIAALNKNPEVDIILMDIQLRNGEDGIKTAEHIHKIYNKPVIFITSYSDQHTIKRAKMIEPYGYILKPVQGRELFIAIEIALHRHAVRGQLSEQHIFLDNILNSIKDAVIVTGPDDEILYKNTAGNDILFIDDFVGSINYNKSLNELLNEKYTVNDGDKEHLKICTSEKNPRLVYEKIESPILKNNDEVLGTVNVFRDVSPRVQYQKALEDAKQIAEGANRQKSEFLANMSHELRTPLNSIIGMTELSLDLLKDSEEREYLEIIKQSSHSLLFLINSILDYSKLEAGKFKIHQMPFNVIECIEDVYDKIMIELNKKGLSFLIDIADDCPTGFLGDPERIKQLITNLMVNAMKFTYSGGITVALSYEDGMLVVSVKDTGIGIPEEKLDEIFTSFSQIDGTLTRAHGGVGLGLSITKRIVDLMHGTITVESKEAEGSSFTLALPMSPYEECNSRRLYPPKEKKFKLILVNMDQGTKKMITRMFLYWGASEIIQEDSMEDVYSINDGDLAESVIILGSNAAQRNVVTHLKHEFRFQALYAVRLIVLSSFGTSDELFWKTNRITPYIFNNIPKEKKVYRVLNNILSGPDVENKSEQNNKKVSDKNMRILLAEDDENSRILVKRLLTKKGYAITDVKSGKEVIDLLAAGPYDLILMDIQMPVMDGLEASRIIRSGLNDSIDPHIPIIALTAHALVEDRKLCREVGMNDFISKPFDSERLIYIINKYAGKSKTKEEAIVIKETDNKDEVKRVLDDTIQQLKLLATTSFMDDDLRKMESLALFLKKRLTELNSDEIASFVFKFILALRLRDEGKIKKALQTLENIMFV